MPVTLLISYCRKRRFPSLTGDLGDGPYVGTPCHICHTGMAVRPCVCARGCADCTTC